MSSPADATYAQRIAFVSEVAVHLHRYGTTAQRLEGAINALSQQLGLDCQPWTNPTGLILSFSDPAKPPGLSDTTRVIRLAPGENDLHKLSEADRIADAVGTGRMSISQGQTALRGLDRPPGRRWQVMQVVAFGLSAAGLAGIWRLPWLDICTAGLIGLAIGLFTHLSDRRPRMKEAHDAVAAMLAGFVAILVGNFVAPLNLNTVVIASLVPLLPGLMLTNSVNELTSGHWVSGVARFAGAISTILKLTVGSLIAVTVAKLLGVYPDARAWRPQPDWVEWVALLTTAFAFAILFRASVRDYAWVMAAAVAGFLLARYGGQTWGGAAGVFLAAMTMTAAGNLFARLTNRPGAIIRVPGIIMLVPGSASLRGLMNLVQQLDAGASSDALLDVINIIMALVAGLLFGNLLAPARKNL